MCDGDGVDDRQAKSGTVGSPVCGAASGEALEDSQSVFVADAGARVGDPESQPAAFNTGPEPDPAAGIGVAAGVVGEGNHRLGDALRVEDRLHFGNGLHDEIAVAKPCDLVEHVGGQRCDIDQFGTQEGRLFGLSQQQ